MNLPQNKLIISMGLLEVHSTKDSVLACSSKNKKISPETTLILT